MKRLIIFLIRRRLRLRKFEWFRFTNQKTTDTYCFNNTGLVKLERGSKTLSQSGVSLNWLLDDQCEIKSLGRMM